MSQRHRFLVRRDFRRGPKRDSRLAEELPHGIEALLIGIRYAWHRHSEKSRGKAARRAKRAPRYNSTVKILRPYLLAERGGVGDFHTAHGEMTPPPSWSEYQPPMSLWPFAGASVSDAAILKNPIKLAMGSEPNAQ